MQKTIYILPGDGIGVEICNAAEAVIDCLNRTQNVHITVKSGLIGGSSFDKYQTPLTDETLREASSADAILLGAVGGSKWDNVAREMRPEAGLLRIRKSLDLFANLRPAMTFDCLSSASSLKPEIIEGLDIMIVRELTAGVYFGTPRGMQTLEDGTERCVDTQSYTKNEIIRIAIVAFELARKRNCLVHSTEKSNVMETGVFWRDIVTKVHKNFPDVRLQHMYADNCAMQLVRDPKQFDVILTDNLFGDILSDTAAMCTGSLGMLPSASLGSVGKDGRQCALYEPVHGSAPDIAGRDIANPCAAILSLGMMMKYSFNRSDLCTKIETAIDGALKNNFRTKDIMTKGKTLVGTREMQQEIVKQLTSL